jgi:hypothetical protein
MPWPRTAPGMCYCTIGQRPPRCRPALRGRCSRAHGPPRQNVRVSFSLSSFAVRSLKRSDGDSWTDEVVVLIEGRDRLATLGRGPWQTWIGRSPEDVLGPDSPWVAAAEPHDSFVARCDCGIEGCGALVARISLVGGLVVWEKFRRGSDANSRTETIEAEPFRFRASEYQAAILGQGDPAAWEPVTRQACVLAATRLKEIDLAAQGLRAVDFRSRGDDEIIVNAFTEGLGDGSGSVHRAVVSPTEGELPGELAGRLLGYVTSGGLVNAPDAERTPLRS